VIYDNYNVSVIGGTDGSIDLSIGGNGFPTGISWSGPQGFTSTNEDLFNLSAGFYTVTISDEFGCEIQDTITLIEPGNIVLPNGFTPNGDGFNDFAEDNEPVVAVGGKGSRFSDRCVVCYRLEEFTFGSAGVDIVSVGSKAGGVCQKLADGDALFSIVAEFREVPGGRTVDVKRVVLNQLHGNGGCGYDLGKRGKIIDGGGVGGSGSPCAPGVAECLVENGFPFMEDSDGCSGKDLFVDPFLHKLLNRREVIAGGYGGHERKAEQEEQCLAASPGRRRTGGLPTLKKA